MVSWAKCLLKYCLLVKTNNAMRWMNHRKLCYGKEIKRRNISWTKLFIRKSRNTNLSTIYIRSCKRVERVEKDHKSLEEPLDCNDDLKKPNINTYAYVYACRCMCV